MHQLSCLNYKICFLHWLHRAFHCLRDKRTSWFYFYSPHMWGDIRTLFYLPHAIHCLLWSPFYCIRLLFICQRTVFCDECSVYHCRIQETSRGQNTGKVRWWQGGGSVRGIVYICCCLYFYVALLGTSWSLITFMYTMGRCLLWTFGQFIFSLDSSCSQTK